MVAIDNARRKHITPGSRSLVALALLGIGATAHAGHANPLLEASLDARAEVSSSENNRRVVDSRNGRGEAYVFGIDGDPTTLWYVLTVEKIQLVPVGSGMMAHIHEGPRGVSGPVVAVLAGPEDGNAADCLTEGEGVGTPSPKFPTAEVGIVQRILYDPAAFYINVHNPEYPNGAICGQLEEQESNQQSRSHSKSRSK